jgi:hypothetical protein
MRLIGGSRFKGKFGQLRELNADLRPAISGSGNRFKTNGPGQASWPARDKISQILVRFQQWLDEKACRCHFWYQSPDMLPVFSIGQNKSDFGWLNKESAQRAIDTWLEDGAQLHGAIYCFRQFYFLPERNITHWEFLAQKFPPRLNRFAMQ